MYVFTIIQHCAPSKKSNKRRINLLTDFWEIWPEQIDMIEWNDSTQLKTKKMPRPLMPSSCWFASLDNTNQWDSQASESSTQKEKRKRRDRFFFFSYYHCQRTLAKHSFSNIFEQFFKQKKKTRENAGWIFFAIVAQKVGS